MRISDFQKHQSHPLYRFIIALVIILITGLLQYSIWDYIRPAPFILFYPGIILASLFGEGLVAIILSMIIAQLFFMHPFDDFLFLWPNDLVRQIIFLLSTLLMRSLVLKLAQAKTIAEDAVESLKDEKEIREKFVSTLTHDLQTPLTAMKLGTQLLLRGVGDEEKLKLNGERVLNNMARMETMIKDLLDSNTLRAGKCLPVVIQALNLNSLANKTLNNLISIHGERFILKQPHQIDGYWSEDSIQRIIENLCSNAVKYGAKDKPITIGLNVVGDLVEIEVHNQGNVIPPEEQEILFLSFERSKSAKKSGQKGWGLGLTLVQGLSESMGGTVNVVSNHQQGTIFKVILPVDARGKTL